MRSTIIMATCALAVFAAPVPEPIYKTGGTGCVRVVAGVCVRTGKREVEAPVTANIEARFPEANNRGKKNSRSFKSDSKHSPSPFGRGSHPRDIEIDARSLEPFGRGSHPRDVEDDEASFEARSPAPAPFGRDSHPRDVEDQDDIDVRAIRNQGGHKTRAIDNIEARGAVRNQDKRSVREKEVPVDPIDARAIRNQGGHKARAIDNIEARGAVRNQDERSDADVEVREAALSRPKGTRREAALSRPKGNPRRSPALKRVPGGVRGSN